MTCSVEVMMMMPFFCSCRNNKYRTESSTDQQHTLSGANVNSLKQTAQERRCLLGRKVFWRKNGINIKFRSDYGGL